MSELLTVRDIITLVGLTLFVLLTVFIAEILRRKNKISGKTSRKIVHIVVGNAIIVFPIGFTNKFAALIGPTFFIFFTYFTCPKSPIKQLRLKGVEEGHAFGTVYYSIAFTVLTAILFKPGINQENIILLSSFLPLVWGDGLGAVIGEINSQTRKYYHLFGSKRSLLGSWAVAFSTTIIVFIVISIYRVPLLTAFYLALLIGATTAITEALSPKGFDNILIPFVNFGVLYGIYYYLNYDFYNIQNSINWQSVIASVILAVMLAIAGISFKVLTVDGAIAGLFFGLVILGLGSWTLGFVYGTFFVIGSLFTLIGKKRKKEIVLEFEKSSSARDSVQASVNSLIPALLAFIYIIYPNLICITIGTTALAVSLADTLGTEIGTLSKNNPVLSVKPWKRVDKGHPGAVSLLGVIGTILGAIIIALTGWGTSFIDNYVAFNNKQALFYLISVFVGGVIGAYSDSILALSIQRLQKCKVCSKITEKTVHCGEETIYFKGIKWIKNDVVNLLAIIIGAIVGGLIHFLLMTFF